MGFFGRIFHPISNIFVFIDSINQKGYSWFLDNLVNNNFGGWPLVIGSDNFTKNDFDPSIVTGE